MKNANKYEKQSRVMKKAWSEYKSYDNQVSSFQTEKSFAECLADAWIMENTTIQDVYTSINENTVKEIRDILITCDFNSVVVLEVVAERSSSYVADIARKAIKYSRISEKQAWCVAYEYKKVA